MTVELRERLTALAGAIEAAEFLAYEAETSALPGVTADGLQRARLLLTKMRMWLRERAKVAE